MIKNNKSYTIIIFGGSLRKGADKTWRSDNFNHIRVLAGYYLYKKLSKNNKTQLIVSGGKGIYKNIAADVPTVSSIMRQELIELGIPDKEITEENKTGTTYQQLIWLKENHKKTWGEVIIISNSYHLARIRTIISYLSELKKLQRIVKITHAENIILRQDKRWKTKIDKMYKSPAMEKIILMESEGVKNIKNGSYKFT